MKLTPKKIKKLAEKALKDKPDWKPAKGYKYLEDCEPGTLFSTECGIKGILIECNVNAQVIVTETPSFDKLLLGKKLIASKTEVKSL